MSGERTNLRVTAPIERRPHISPVVHRKVAENSRSPVQTRVVNRSAQAVISRSMASRARPDLSDKIAPVNAAATQIQFSKWTRLPAKVSKPIDPAELEAEETARKVMRMNAAPAPASALSSAAAPSPSKTTSKGTVQRAETKSGNSVPPQRSTTKADISGGAPLPSSVRTHMEPRFGANFGNVRVHNDTGAAQQAANLHAHAFTVGEHIFFGRDKYQPQSASGRELIAHELTHTIQQEATVQRKADTKVTQRSETKVHRFGISDALDWIADKANYIPGFRLLTIVLGMNPINWASVDRSAANLLRALLEMIPVTGALIAQALDNYGILAKVGAWIEGQVRTLGLVGGQLKGALDKFLDSLSWSDIFDLDDVYERGKRIFTEPITRLIDFGKSLVTDIIGFIRQAILLPLAKLAEGTPSYDLLKAVLGQDPVTGEPVPATPEVLIGGFMKLIGQEEIWENMKKANAIPRAWAWFQGALRGLLGFVRQIPTLFINALKSLEIIDLVLPPKAFLKIAGVFAGFAMQFFTWAGSTIWALLEIIFDVVSPGALGYIKRTGAALKSILQNPLPFVKNLARAAKLGFQQFADRFGSHLKAGLIDWLTGSLEGVYIPRALSLPEVGKFALSVLGVSWASIRGKIVKALGPSGETIMKVAETGVDIIVALVTGGPAAAWELIKEKLTDLKDQVVNGIIGFVTSTLVKVAVPKLIALFIPGAGFISAIISIYDIVMVFVEKISKIIQVVKGFIDSIVAIAGGNIAAAANRVENILGNLLSLAISFLAGFLKLGKVTDKIKDVIEKVRAKVDAAIDKAIAWIVEKAKALYAKGKAAVKSLIGWAMSKSKFTDGEGHEHQIYVDDKAATPRLMIASENPKTAGDFLEFYIKHRGATFETDKKSEIAAARKAVAASDKQVEKIKKEQAAGKTDEQLAPMQQELLILNVALGDALSAVLGSDIGKLKEKYMLEGLTGTFASMPKPKYDDFTADHQPQAAILEGAAVLPYFTASGKMAKRADNRADAGYAINVHKIRHKAGRTYFGKGSATKSAFFGRVPAAAAPTAPDREKQRKALIAELKKELTADVAAMHGVVKDKNNFKDIVDLKLPKKEEDTMIKDIGDRIVAGESQLASQELDSLAN